MSDIKLYELPVMEEQVFELAEAAEFDPEFNGDREESIQACMDTLESIQGVGEVKVEHILYHVKNKQAEADALDARADIMQKEVNALREKAQARNNEAEYWKRYILSYLQATNRPKMKTETFSVWTRKSESVVLNEGVLEEKLPDEFRTVRTTYSANKKAIKEAINNGQVIDFAHLVTKEGLMFR